MTRRIRSAALAGALGVTLLVLATALWSATAHQWAVVTAPGPTTLDEALTLLAAAAALALALWLGLSIVAAVAAHLPGRIGAVSAAVASTFAPAFTRRVATALVGAALGGALSPGAAVAEPPEHGIGAVAARDVAYGGGPGFRTTPGPGFAPTAAATPGRTTEVATAMGAPVSGPAGASTRHTEQAPVPGWVPERPRQRPQASPGLVTTAPHQGTRDIVIRRGDTLWDIVARELGREASDAEVAAAWPLWHAANSDVIGPDPDLILPGQILRAPARATALGG